MLLKKTIKHLVFALLGLSTGPIILFSSFKNETHPYFYLVLFFGIFFLIFGIYNLFKGMIYLSKWLSSF